LEQYPVSGHPTALTIGGAGPARSAHLGRAHSEVLFDDLGDAFLHYYENAAGVVRGEVVRANLRTYLPRTPSDILDVGCGEGIDAAWLTQRGHRVTAIDPSRRMFDAAKKTAAHLSAAERSRLTLHLVDDRSAMSLLRGCQYDVVLCHGVLMYQAEHQAFLRRLCRFVRPGGTLSILTRNADALAYRAASDGNYDEALRLLNGSTVSAGRLGTDSFAHSVDELRTVLRTSKMRLEDWFGVKIFSDGLTHQLARRDLRSLLRLEQAASRRDPYRQTGRLVHLIVSKEHPKRAQ